MKQHIATAIMIRRGIRTIETYRLPKFMETRKALILILNEYNERNGLNLKNMKYLDKIIYDKHMNKHLFDIHFIGKIHTSFEKTKINHKLLVVDRIRCYA